MKLAMILILFYTNGKQTINQYLRNVIIEVINMINISIQTGVRQGDVLSTTLFNLYLNDPDLGLVLYSSLDMSKTIDNLIASASRTLGSITSKYFKIDGFDYVTFTKLYDALVIPILTYGAGI